MLGSNNNNNNNAAQPGNPPQPVSLIPNATPDPVAPPIFIPPAQSSISDLPNTTPGNVPSFFPTQLSNNNSRNQNTP